MSQRETWSNKVDFILACIGAAIGLGNIWMFPWRLGKYGGAAFLIPYVIFVFILSRIGLMGEFAFGRNKQKGAISAFEDVFKEKNLPFGSIVGAIPVLGVSGVFIFYLVVVGWIIKYFSISLLGSFSKIDIPAYFKGFAGQPESIFWHLIAIIITLLIVNMGIKNGIEKANKFMMPSLFVILILLAIRSVTLPGGREGLKFMLLPNWSYLLKVETWIMALGQSFFTLCLGGAAMVVYGSYLKPNEDIPSSALNTVVWNTVASLLAAIVIMPAAFSFGLDPQSGPPLLFITVPFIFKMMPAGYIFGILFFLSVVFAALSSAINLMEVPVEALIDRLNWSRKKSTIFVGALGFVLGLPLDLSVDRLGKFADFVSIYLVPLGAVLAAIAFFWLYGVEKARVEVNKGAKKPVGEFWEFLAKYIFTGVSIIVLILGIIFGSIG